MDEAEYRKRWIIIITSVPREQFEVFRKKGIDKAKEIIISSLEKRVRGLFYSKLESRVEKGLAGVSINGWNNAWKKDAFMLALAGLEIEDKKIKSKKGVFSICRGHPS